MAKRKRKPGTDFFGVGKRRPLNRGQYEKLKKRSLQRIARNFLKFHERWMAVEERFEMRRRKYASEERQFWLSQKELAVRRFFLLEYATLALEREWELVRYALDASLTFYPIVKASRKMLEDSKALPEKITALGKEVKKVRARYFRFRVSWEKQAVRVLEESAKSPVYARLVRELEALRNAAERRRKEYEQTLAFLEKSGKKSTREKIRLQKQSIQNVLKARISAEEKEIEIARFLHRKAGELNCREDFVEELARQIYIQRETTLALQKQLDYYGGLA